MNRSIMKSILRGDRAENSIMQTISIAVSVILISAGTMGTPGLIANARATAAKTTVSTLETAQATYIAKKGSYTNRISQLTTGFMGNAIDLSMCGAVTTATAMDNCASINLITGANLAEGSSCYLSFTKSSAGKVYYIQSKGMSGASGIVEIPQPWPSTPTAVKAGTTVAIADFADPTKGFDASCATGGVWPASLAAAMTKQAMTADAAVVAGDAAPATPANFIVTNKTGNVFDLSWSKSPTANSYTLSYGGTIYNTFPSGDTLSGSVTLPWSTSGNLSLTAFLNSAASTPSNIAVSTTAETLAVSSPSSFNITYQNGNTLNLAWSAATNATEYSLYYSGTFLKTVTSTNASVLLPWSSSGSIKLIAASSSNYSAPVYVAANVPAYMPAVPSVSLATVIGNGGTFSWVPVGGAAGYDYLINGVVTRTSTSGTAPFNGPNGAGYTIQVRAFNGSYTAAWSPALTFSMPSYQTTSKVFTSSGSTGFSGAVTRSNSGLTSVNGRWSVTMQSDGNFVIYDNTNGVPHGSTATYASGAGVYAGMQTDGNLVIYTSANAPVKYTATSGYPGSRLVMQDDGNLVIYNTANVAIWALSTNSGPSFMQKMGW